MVKNLLKAAMRARESAYAPYSEFKVGAAVESGSGKIYTGCNIENASYGLSICAERVAISKAVSDGETTLKRVCVVADTEEPCPPCGACRQFIAEFGSKIEVILANMSGGTRKYLISDLLPNLFHLER